MKLVFHQGVSCSRVSGRDGAVHASECLSWYARSNTELLGFSGASDLDHMYLG